MLWAELKFDQRRIYTTTCFPKIRVGREKVKLQLQSSFL